jgi:hypothetical protein
MTMWLISVIIAFSLGLFVHYFFSKNSNSENKHKDDLERLKLDYQSYRNQVSSHLQRTSELLEGYKHHQSKLESHLFSATQNFANTSLFDSSENIGVLPESASDYLAMRGSGFKDNIIPESEGEYKDIYDLDDLDDLDNKDDKAQPRDYASS